MDGYWLEALAVFDVYDCHINLIAETLNADLLILSDLRELSTSRFDVLVVLDIVR